jgi:hypothetical protein
MSLTPCGVEIFTCVVISAALSEGGRRREEGKVEGEECYSTFKNNFWNSSKSYFANFRKILEEVRRKKKLYKIK